MADTGYHENKRRRTDFDEPSSKNAPPPIINLSTDILAKILGYLTWNGMVCARVCTHFRKTLKQTPVTETIAIRNHDLGKNLDRLGKALPMTEHLVFEPSANGSHPVKAGSDPPDVFMAESNRSYDTRLRSHIDLNHLLEFRKIKELCLNNVELNGKYDCLFRLKSLESIDLSWNFLFVADIGHFSNLPNLRVLQCNTCYRLHGSLDSLVNLKGKLEVLEIRSSKVTGSLADLSEFSALKTLDISYADGITGDIRSILPRQFPSLNSLNVYCTGIYGDRVGRTETEEVMMEWRKVMTHPRPLSTLTRRIRLLVDVDDMIRNIGNDYDLNAMPPNDIELLLVGPRYGYRWRNDKCACEVNWLDPEPSPRHEQYEKYVEELESLQILQRTSFFKGISGFPTPEEYARMVDSERRA